MIKSVSFVLLILGSTAFGQSLTYVSAPNKSQPIEPDKPIGRTLRADETHQYTASLGKGQYLDATINQRGIDVIVRVFGPDGTKVAEIDTPNGDQGDEPVAFEAKTAGDYRIEVSSLEKDVQPGYYALTLNEILSAQVYAARKAERLRQQQAIIGWLTSNAVPLKTVEAGHDFADLQPVKETFKNVRFVGLGEATHGTREFFQVKHRLLEFLVQEMGFRGYAMEASYAAMHVINDYVMGDMNDGTSALNSQGFWTWNTEEVRAIMDWARTYNAKVSPDKRVKFVGFDIQFNQPGKDKLLSYLQRVAPDRADSTKSFFAVNLDSLNSALSTSTQQIQMQNELKSLKIKYRALYEFLQSNGSDLVAKTGQAEYEQMQEYARVLNQYIDSYSSPTATGSVSRDQFMADNFKRLVEHEPAGTRFVLWAHNGHIATDTTRYYKPMGAYLRQFYGDDYYALGFSFNQGSINAREAQPKDPKRRMLRPFTAPPALTSSVDWYLGQTRLKTFVVDFRAPAKNTDVNHWLDTPMLMRGIGSVYWQGADQNFFSPITIRQRFDGLLFINFTTPSRPNLSVKNVAGRDEK